MILSADFETTTDENDCRVWAWGIVDIENVGYYKHGNSMDTFFEYIQSIDNSTLYFHNLKFDGEFILCYLFEHGFRHIVDKKEREDKTFTTLISDKGQFYCMDIYFKVGKKNDLHVKIMDSLKILPFSVAQIAKGFGLPISKLEIDYKATRPVGHELTEEEIEYLHNDVLIVAMALSSIFKQGLTAMTQGSNALQDYKNKVTKEKFDRWFPIPEYDSDVRQSYRGGFTYADPRFVGKDMEEGIVLDVNSLYPSVMRYEKLPFGKGVYFEGQYKKNRLYPLYTQMFRCSFELKEDHIPTVQLKNNNMFVPTQYLSSSDGELITLCMTSVDLELFLAHYDVYEMEYLGGYMFKATLGLFDSYIDYWTKVKIDSKINGNKMMYTLAKLMLNALYGKFALNPNVQSKIPFYDGGMIRYRLGEKERRNPIYIPIGTFVTSYARRKTISSAQAVYDRFMYADTDSLHLRGLEVPKELEISDTKLGAWKHEFTFSKARYLRQKSYIEYGHDMKNGLPDGDDYWKVTCAGMPESLHKYVTWDNFHDGVIYSREGLGIKDDEKFDSKLQMRHVSGGIVLKDIDFSIKRGHNS